MTRRFGRWGMRTAVGLAMLALTASVASAGSVLLWDDFSFFPPPDSFPASSASNWPTAITSLGHSLTQITQNNPQGDTDFLNALALNTWDLVVVQFDFDTHSVEPALANYIANGGKVIFSNFDSTNDTDFGVTEAGSSSGVDALLHLTPLFSTGLVSPLLVSDAPGYTPFWRSFTTAETVAGTFDSSTYDGTNAAIVVGNSSRTIINGFLGDTIVPPDDEIQLYRNEIGYLLPAVVPMPASLVLVGLGAGVLAALRQRRKRTIS